MYKIEQLKNPTKEDITQVLRLFESIEDSTCDSDSYLKYLKMAWSNIALFVIRDEGKIVGYTNAVCPSILEPHIGWLPFSAVDPHVPYEVIHEGLKVAEGWLKSLGAEKYYFQSSRKRKALKKLYNMTPSKEVLYEKQL